MFRLFIVIIMLLWSCTVIADSKLGRVDDEGNGYLITKQVNSTQIDFFNNGEPTKGLTLGKEVKRFGVSPNLESIIYGKYVMTPKDNKRVIGTYVRILTPEGDQLLDVTGDVLNFHISPNSDKAAIISCDGSKTEALVYTMKGKKIAERISIFDRNPTQCQPVRVTMFSQDSRHLVQANSPQYGLNKIEAYDLISKKTQVIDLNYNAEDIAYINKNLLYTVALDGKIRIYKKNRAL